MPAYSVPYVHSGDPGYAPPLLRAPSPTSSIGTDYSPDETSPTEADLTAAEFEHMCQQRLQLSDMRPDERLANYDPLLPKPRNSDEETGAGIVGCLYVFCSTTQAVLYNQVMHHLRLQVRRLQEDALFEQTLLRPSVITEEKQPSSSDLDDILQSMMGTSIASSTAPASALTPGLVNTDLLSPKPLLDFPSPAGSSGFIFPDPSSARMVGSASTPAPRRVTRNMGKTPR